MTRNLVVSLLVVLLTAGCGTPSGGNDGGNDADSGSGGGAGGGSGGGGGGGTGGGSGGGTGGGGGSDGGTDAGVNCATVSLHASLGAFDLQTGYTLRETAAISPSYSAIASVADGGVQRLYGLDSVSGAVRALGAWPNLTDAGIVYDTFPPDAGAGGFVNAYLASDGRRLMSGYAKTGGNGHVAIYDTQSGGAPAYVFAHGNFTAAALPDAFLVNGGGISTTMGELALYAVKPGTTPATQKLATWPSANVASGNTAATTNGVIVAGYYDLGDFTNKLLAVPPSAYAAALTNGTTVSLTGATQAYSGVDLLGVSSFGDHLVLQRGVYDSVTFAPITTDVSRVQLTVTGSGTQTVTAATPTPILTARNSCSSVLFMAPMGADLLVAISDRQGARLVRITSP